MPARRPQHHDTLMLLDDPRIAVWVDEAACIVWMVRTAAPLPFDESGLRDFYAKTIESMASIQREHYGILVDGREAVGRNDEAFERVMAEVRFPMFGGFRRVAALIRTVAGRLQLARYRSGDETIELQMFATTDEALVYLTE